ncbi:MAG: two component transcriptional regulator, LuxR family [Conexibacter sp.]|jgi:two-component system, NarL family, nitrate/nitrite response regulator NarL|nr:two component transcriptional regulator, LuxR family [Conexibacter sp.]
MSEPAPRVRGRVGVVVADDHPVYRDGIVNLLKAQAEIEVLGEAADGREALDRIRELRPDVIVLDVSLPGVDGFGVLDAAKRQGLATRVVLISAREDSATIYHALSVGADAFLPKSSTGTEIVDSVLAVARGKTVIASAIQAGLLQEIRMRRPADDRPVLSSRELEVLRLVADGLSAIEIGERLHLSRTTVRTHLQHVYEKFGVSDRTSAVVHALRRGLLL